MLDDPKRVFHIGTDTGLAVFHGRKLRYRLTPGHNVCHKFKQFRLAGASGAQVENMGLLVHDPTVASSIWIAHVYGGFEHLS